jgi:hypothetical protein
MAVHTSAFSSPAPSYLDKLQCAKHAWPDVTNVIDATRRHLAGVTPNGHVELELRFGKKTATGFQPTISASAFQALEDRFDTGRDWAKVVDWHNTHVYFHGSAVLNDKRTLRTEVTYPPGCDSVQQTECIHKELLLNHDYRTVPMTATMQDTVDIRLAVNTERKVPDHEIPMITEPLSMHIKVRKSYFYAPTGFQMPVWCYALTKRWTGKTLQDTLMAMQRQEPTYEMEIECLESSYLNQDSGQVAAKLMYKLCDILDIIEPTFRDRQSFVIEPVDGMLLWNRSKK